MFCKVRQNHEESSLYTNILLLSHFCKIWTKGKNIIALLNFLLGYFDNFNFAIRFMKIFQIKD